MAIVPVHPLQLPGQVPAYARWESHGSDRWGPTLDARGLSPGLITVLQPQRASVHGATSAVLGTCEVKSTLVSSANGYEGLGLYVAALKRVGDNVVRVWHNDLLQSGRKDWWLNDLPNEWVRAHIPVQIPEQHQPDFVDTAWIVRGSSGQVRLDAAELHDYYTRYFVSKKTDSTWTNFSAQSITGLYGESSTKTHRVHYVDTHTARISKGTKITYSVKSYLKDARIFRTDDGVRKQDFQLSVALKLLRRDGNYDWVPLGSENAIYYQSGWTMGEIALNWDGTTIAENAYTQFEVVVILTPKESDAVGNTSVWYELLKVTVVVDQPLAIGSE